MPQTYLTEYFMVCGLPVAAVKTNDGKLLQTWAADKAQGRLRRDARLLADIESDSRVRPMLKTDFDRYCQKHRIDPAVPERAVLQTLTLMKGSVLALSVSREEENGCYMRTAMLAI
ncbi:MAG: hypothetical protein HYS17_10670 [Micavibrio aeruginosavorus]|uniref:Uncharacterized protein n=1 Tax=Micavibrio aeruginosavorus TaxID=349221 RepID=A0A7T5R1R5_9BACT|nr:MAG: hypothetical protein HYS17_10670 [Micavibrio aeruginosavorus]